MDILLALSVNMSSHYGSYRQNRSSMTTQVARPRHGDAHLSFMAFLEVAPDRSLAVRESMYLRCLDVLLMKSCGLDQSG